MSTLDLCITQAPPCWKLVSGDAESVALQLYLRLAGVPFERDISSYFYSPIGRGDLPIAQRGQQYAHGDECIGFIQKHYPEHNIDEKLAPEERADVLALSTLVRERLAPAVSFIMFADDENFAQVRRSLLRSLPFQFVSAPLVRKLLLQKSSIARIHSEKQAYAVIEECYAMLSAKLGKTKFMLGDRPSSVDAIVGGHLCLHRAVNLPKCGLLKRFKEHQNLGRYATMLEQNYLRTDSTWIRVTPSAVDESASAFDSESSTPFAARETQEKFDESDDEDDSVKAKTPEDKKFERDSKYWIIGATGAFALLALIQGAIRLPGSAKPKRKDGSSKR